MSSTGVAPRIMVDGPIPRPAAYGLMSVAQSLDQVDSGRWMAGVNVLPYPPGLPNAQDPCVPSSPATKETPTGVTVPEAFQAFTAYLGDICTASGVGDWNEFRRRVNVALNARLSWILERQLVEATYADQPHLGDTNATLVASGSALSATVALAYLEDEIAETGQQGVIHITPSVATVLGEILTDRQGVLRTPAGTPVVVGQGYVGAAAPDDSSAAAAGQSWIYASGPVFYRASEETFTLPATIEEALDREDNTVIYRAERDVLAGWDGGLQAAALVDWSPA